jgi:two-component system sensor histidine kinase YesM
MNAHIYLEVLTEKLMNRHVISRISLRNKLVISFIMIIMPMFILSFLSINLYSNEIKNKVISTATGNNEQIIHNLDNSLSMLMRISEYPLYDETLIEILKKDYSRLENSRYVRSVDFAKAKDLLNNNIVFYSNLIDSVWLYSMDNYDLRGRALVETMDISYSPAQEEWLPRIIEADGGAVIIGIHQHKQKIPGKDYVVSIGRLIKDKSSREAIGLIIIDVDIQQLEQLWMERGITRNTLFYLIDDNGRIIYSQNKEQINQSIYYILNGDYDFEAQSGRSVLLNGTRYQLISSRSAISKWRAVSIIPEKELFSYNEEMYKITLLIGCIVVILSLGGIYIITTSITRPIYELSGTMRKIGEGNFNLDVGKYYGEMGVIGNAVNAMQTKIKELIRKIYLEEEEKRRAELNALQAQINPHFLYNTLSAIKWMANIQGAVGIEKALNSMAFLMAYTSKWNSDYISIADEMVFVENYISILDIRYYNKFSVNYDIDKNVYNYKTLKFLLQPIIENSVFHGFEGIHTKGEINIKIVREDGNIVFTVADNGQGFDTDKLKSILEQDEESNKQKFNSIGLSNVHKRIKLHFGEEYGITIHSRPGAGTKVIIVIPAISMKLDDEGENHENTDR